MGTGHRIRESGRPAPGYVRARPRGSLRSIDRPRCPCRGRFRSGPRLTGISQSPPRLLTVSPAHWGLGHRPERWDDIAREVLAQRSRLRDRCAKASSHRAATVVDAGARGGRLIRWPYAVRVRIPLGCWVAPAATRPAWWRRCLRGRNPHLRFRFLRPVDIRKRGNGTGFLPDGRGWH